MNAVALLLYQCMLQPGTPVFEVQDLIGRPADCNDRRIDDFIVMLDTTRRVFTNKSNQVFQGVTST